MRRWLTIVALLIVSLCAATPADAFWRHHGGWGRCGWGGYGYRGGGWGGYGGYGYRGFGYGGYGWRGSGYRGYGYPGYYGGGYGSPYGGFSYGYPYGGFGYSGYGYPGFSSFSPYGYGGTTITVGYPGLGYFGQTSGRPTTNLAMESFRPAATPAIAGVTPSAANLQQFLGLKDIHPVVLNGNLAAGMFANASPAPRNLGDVLARVSNVESRRKAERMIAEGDELFRTQNFHSALQRYKLAASTAPDVAEALWRQGHALVATHNYDLATTAFKRAIALTDDLGRGGFRLTDLYAAANMTKAQHLESLAEWAMKRNGSPDPYFLLGVFLNYDGQTARADRFFQKASDLAGISGGHIAVFLEPAIDATPSLLQRITDGTPKPRVVPVSIQTEI